MYYNYLELQKLTVNRAINYFTIFFVIRKMLSLNFQCKSYQSESIVK